MLWNMLNDLAEAMKALDGKKIWVRKTFSKPASLKRASLVAFPVAISHKVSVDTKTLRFFNPDAKNFTKMNLNTVPKMGPPELSKRTKEKHFHGPIFGPQNRKINSKGRPVRTKIQLRLFKQKAYRFGTEECPHMQSLIWIDFPAPKMEPESAHVVSAVSVHWLQCGDCDAARPRQHTTPGQKFFLH